MKKLELELEFQQKRGLVRELKLFAQTIKSHEHRQIYIDNVYRQMTNDIVKRYSQYGITEEHVETLLERYQQNERRIKKIL